MFMDKESIRKCILSLKVKNSEEFDGIPQRILFDARSTHKLVKIHNTPLVTLKWLFYLHLYTLCHKSWYTPPPTCVTSLMNDPKVH